MGLVSVKLHPALVDIIHDNGSNHEFLDNSVIYVTYYVIFFDTLSVINSLELDISLESTRHDTRSLVYKTADELLFEGTRPTVANVRERTGRGSASTINSALREWWLDLGNRLVQSETRPDIPESLSGLFTQLWDSAVEHARISLDSHWKEADKLISEAEEKVKTALLSQEQSLKRVEGLESQLDELNSLRISLERELASERTQRQLTENRLIEIREEADRAVNDNKNLLTQSENQLELLKRNAAETEKRFMQDIDIGRASAKRLEEKLEQKTQDWRNRELEILGMLSDEQKKSVQTATELGLVKKQLELVESGLKSLREDKEGLVAENSRVEERASQIREQNKQLERKCNELSAQCLELEKNNQQLSDNQSQSKRGRNRKTGGPKPP